MRHHAYNLSLYSITVVGLLMTMLVLCTHGDQSEARAPSADGTLAYAVWRPLTLGVVTDKEMNVFALDSEGAAEFAGIQIGDRLVSVNGVAFTQGRDAIQSALGGAESSSEGDSVTIDENGDAMQSGPQPVPPQVIGQPETAVETVASVTPSILAGRSVFITIERDGQVKELPLDISIQPRYGDLPTPTPLDPRIGLLYF